MDIATWATVGNEASLILVCLVHLVSFVQAKNQTDQIDQMNKTG